MPLKRPFDIYRDRLWPTGHALWKPNPLEGIYDQVSVGDVGYIREGGFIRMFNVTLPSGDESNKSLGEPCLYDPLSSDSFTIRRETFGKVDHYSYRVSRDESVGNIYAASPDDAEYVTYRCRGRGAVLSLPNGGIRRDVIHMRVFEDYIRRNADTWFKWSKSKGLPIKGVEDIVFVHGCTLVSSWAAAVFDDNTGNAQLSLASKMLDNGGTGFVWSNIRGAVEYHDSQLNSVCSLLDALTCSALTCFPLSSQKNIPYLHQNRCVFIKCLRARRILFWSYLRHAEEWSAEEWSAEERSVEERSVEERSVEERSVEERCTEESCVEERCIEERSAEEWSVEEWTPAPGELSADEVIDAEVYGFPV